MKLASTTLLCGSLALATPALHAETVVGLTTTNALVTFDSATPGSASAPLTITGLSANERVLGIDRRPSTGLLYGLGSAGRIYTLDAGTGQATFVAGLTANPADLTNPFSMLSGGSYGVDFNPVPDAGQVMPSFRVTSNVGENLRIQVNATGVGQVFTDAALNVPAGGNPGIAASAYTNNDTDPATGTMLFGIDFLTDALYQQTVPNDGTLVQRGALGVDTTGVVGFDVSGLSGIAYASLTNPISGKSGFYTINLATGAATLLGDFGIGGDTAIAPGLTGIALAPVPEPGTWALLLAGLFAMGTLVRRRAGSVV